MTIKLKLTEEDLHHAVQAYVAAKHLGMVIKQITFDTYGTQVGAEVTLEEQPPPPDAWGR